MILVGIAFFFATFNFASSQDQGYADDDVMTTQRDRNILHIAAMGSVYCFLITALLTEKAGESLATKLPRLAAIAQSIRGSLRTRQQTRIAPIFRKVFMAGIVLSFIPPVVGLVLYVVRASERNELKNDARAKRARASRKRTCSCRYWYSSLSGANKSWFLGSLAKNKLLLVLSCRRCRSRGSSAAEARRLLEGVLLPDPPP
jgi:hypothetical protein